MGKGANVSMATGANGSSTQRCLSSFVDGGSKESHKYYLARRTVLEMLRDRGYLVPNSEIELSLQDFREKYGTIPDESRLRISALHQNDPSDKVLVIFWGANVINLSGVRAIARQILDEGTLGRFILVIQNQMTSHAVKGLESFTFKTEIFQVSDLLVSDVLVIITKHQELSDDKPPLKKHSLTEKQMSSAGAAYAEAKAASVKAEEEEEEEGKGELRPQYLNRPGKIIQKLTLQNTTTCLIT